MCSISACVWVQKVLFSHRLWPPITPWLSWKPAAGMPNRIRSHMAGVRKRSVESILRAWTTERVTEGPYRRQVQSHLLGVLVWGKRSLYISGRNGCRSITSPQGRSRNYDVWNRRVLHQALKWTQKLLHRILSWQLTLSIDGQIDR